MNRAIFLDKDGTIMEDVPYNVDPNRIVFMPDLASLREVQQMGYKLIIITNQSGIARGYFTENAVGNVKLTIAEKFVELDMKLDGFYYCPHHPKGTIPEYTKECLCRKPEPGLLFQAAQHLDIDLPSSYFIGDILNDIEAGNKACCNTILLDNGHETEWKMNNWNKQFELVKSLTEAVELIKANEMRKVVTL